MPDFSIVVPVYCNEGSLEELHVRLAKVAESFAEDKFEFIFVDDGSHDASYEVLGRLHKYDTRVRVIKLTRNFGEGGAILAGFHAAQGKYIGTIAADLQEDPEHFVEMIQKCKSGAQVVLGIRSDREDRNLFSELFYRLMRRFVYADYPPEGFDTTMMSRAVLTNLLANSHSGSLPNVTLIWLGYPYKVVPIVRKLRPYGKSQYDLSRKLVFLIDSLATFSVFPLRAMSLIGGGLALCGLLFAVFTILEAFCVGIEVPGWASLVVFFAVLQGATLLILGIVGEYLWRTLSVARHRPSYVVEKEL